MTSLKTVNLVADCWLSDKSELKREASMQARACHSRNVEQMSTVEKGRVIPRSNEGEDASAGVS
jgi:hypothetical protein